MRKVWLVYIVEKVKLWKIVFLTVFLNLARYGQTKGTVKKSGRIRRIATPV